MDLKKITDYLNINIQKALGELIGNEEFSYFNGKEVFVGFKPYLNEKKFKRFARAAVLLRINFRDMSPEKNQGNLIGGQRREKKYLLP